MGQILKHFFFLTPIHRIHWDKTTPICGLRGWLGPVGFTFHQGPGVYWNGRKWYVWSNITKEGYRFMFEEDEIIYRWPWRGDPKYLNVSLSYSAFNTLEEIHNFWADYFTHLEENEPQHNPSG